MNSKVRAIQTKAKARKNSKRLNPTEESKTEGYQSEPRTPCFHNNQHSTSKVSTRPKPDKPMAIEHCNAKSRHLGIVQRRPITVNLMEEKSRCGEQAETGML
ncbi:unnamed protein product [Linum trigynum]|uniref:Uncharacterized protein n=1 Tax=Linum trigynum TaxID=586398 RepID=A0AAV2G4D0_9ROSI